MHRARRRHAPLIVALLTALALVVGVAFVAPAGAAAGLDPIAVARVQMANCQLLAAHSSGSQRTRAQDCVSDQRRIIALLTPSTPSPTATATPTTAPPTTTPPTTAPPTTTPPTSPTPGGFPDATNTGPAAGVHLTVISGDFDASTAGATISGIEVHGCTTISAANVRIVDSRFLGDCFYAVHNLAPGLVMDRVEISCNGGSGTGVTDSEYVIRHANIHGCENGLNISSAGNVELSDSWVHDLTFIAGQSHTDGVQIGQGSGNISLRHNRIVVCSDCNSPVIMWDEGDPQNHDLALSDSWVEGGRYDVYCPRDDTTNVAVTGNTMVLGWSGAYSNSCGGTHSSWAGNVDSRTGASIEAA